MSVHESSRVDVQTIRAAGANLPLRRGNRAIVEAGEDAVGRLGLERAVAEDVRRREVTAARRLEDLEHRVAVVEVAERAAASRHPIHGRAEAAGRSCASPCGQVVRSPVTTSRPPPPSRYRFSALPPPAGGKLVLLRITTARLSNDAGVIRDAVVTST
jgi:hypothetical protein